MICNKYKQQHSIHIRLTFCFLYLKQRHKSTSVQPKFIEIPSVWVRNDFWDGINSQRSQDWGHRWAAGRDRTARDPIGVIFKLGIRWNLWDRTRRETGIGRALKVESRGARAEIQMSKPVPSNTHGIGIEIETKTDRTGILLEIWDIDRK